MVIFHTVPIIGDFICKLFDVSTNKNLRKDLLAVLSMSEGG